MPKQSTKPERELPRIKGNRDKAAERLAERADEGQKLRATLNMQMLYTEAWKEAAAAAEEWDSFNLDMLRAMFTTDEVANSYFYAAPHYAKTPMGMQPRVRFGRLVDGLDKRVAELQTIRKKLSLWEVAGEEGDGASRAEVPSVRYRDVHIHIEGGNVGQLNLGQVIGNIETHLKAITGPSGDELSRVIKELVEAVGADAKLSEQAKREAIESVDLLASTAAQPPDKRALGPVKMVLAGMAGLLGGGSSATTIWQAAEPLLHAHFGI